MARLFSFHGHFVAAVENANGEKKQLFIRYNEQTGQQPPLLGGGARR